ncbi:MAG: lysophospholipase [Bacilli bacterium]|nr:lysophospholipase [Bacilli bacterium]
MEVINFTVKGRKKLNLSVFKVLPETDPKAVVQIFHGMGEHKNRYIDFAKFLAKNGYAVFAHDHRKHGASVEKPEDVGIFTEDDVWENVVADCNAVNKEIKKDFPNLPVIVLGHSMGSIIARKYISKFSETIDYAIIMGTIPPIFKGKAFAPLTISKLLNLFNKKNKRSNFLAELLNKPLNKEYQIKRTKFDWLTNDIRVVDHYIDDPLCGYSYTPRFYLEFFKSLVDINTADTILKTKDMPILFISGKDDPVGEKGEGVIDVSKLYSGYGFQKLTVQLMDNNRHEILNEVDKEKTYQYILNWMNSQLK